MTGSQKKLFLEEGAARNMLTKFKIRPLQNIFKVRSRIVIFTLKRRFKDMGKILN
jgi:hypothetical protein